MPLRRTTITAASRVMLPTYVLFFAGVGLSLLTSGAARLMGTPVFAYADQVVDLHLWGAGFLAVAALLAAALAAHSRALFRGALAVALVWMLGWTLVALLAAINGGATYAAWTWPAFVATACWASLVSLATGER